MHRPWPLIGRTRELESVAALLAGGDRSAAVLAGPAGVGKTRLASECMAPVERLGRSTAQVKGNQATRGIPFGALTPLLPGGIGSRLEPADMLWRAREAIIALGQGTRLVLWVDDA